MEDLVLQLTIALQLKSALSGPAVRKGKKELLWTNVSSQQAPNKSQESQESVGSPTPSESPAGDHGSYKSY